MNEENKKNPIDPEDLKAVINKLSNEYALLKADNIYLQIQVEKNSKTILGMTERIKSDYELIENLKSSLSDLESTIEPPQ